MRTLDGHGFAGEDSLLSQCIEHCDARAQLGCEFNWVDVLGDADDCFGAERDVLAVPTVTGHAVDDLVLAHLREASTAGLAGVCVGVCG